MVSLALILSVQILLPLVEILRPAQARTCQRLIQDSEHFTSQAIATMGQPSFQASNAIIYLTYAAFL